MDWNWFFSAFAQCGAAIIGVIGAFLISLKINNDNRISDKINEIQLFHEDYNNYILRLKRLNFKKYIEGKIALSNAINDYSEYDCENLDLQSFIDSVYFDEPNMISIDDELKEAYNKLLNNYNAYHNNRRQIQDTKMWALQKDQAVHGFISEANHLIKQIRAIRSQLVSIKDNIDSLIGVGVFLVFFLLIIVIYPLHFLPVKSGTKTIKLCFDWNTIIETMISTQGIFLILFFLVFFGFVFYFIWYSQKQKNLIYKNLKESKIFTDVNAYSKYFVNHIV